MSDYIYGSSLRAAKSKANYLFEGDFRRRPNQNLSGASRSLARGELLQQAAEQRQNREDVRRREQASIKLQSAWRGYCVRRCLASNMRLTFDKTAQRVLQTNTTLDNKQLECDLNLLIKEFVVHYHSELDENRMNILIDLILRNRHIAIGVRNSEPDLWLYKITKLLKINLGLLRKHCTSADCRYLIFLEQYTQIGEILNETNSDNLWFALVRENFYSTARQIVDSKETHDSEFSQVLLRVIERSLNVKSSHASLITLSFFNQFCKGPLCTQIDQLYLPSLIQSQPKGLEPKCILSAFESLLKSTTLWPSKYQSVVQQMDKLINSKQIHDCAEAIWLCYSFIKMMYNRLESLTNSEKENYLTIVSNLIKPAEYITNISLMQVANSEDSNDEQDDIEITTRTNQINQYHTEINNVVTRLVNLINDIPHVNGLKSIIFNSEMQTKCNSAIINICNLMLSHEPLAIFNCRLLYTIAFSKDFPRALWKSIISSTSTSLYGSNTPIYMQLVRGDNINPESWRLFLPQLRLFCSLYSYLLPTLDDDEFYSDNDKSMFEIDIESKQTSTNQSVGSKTNQSTSLFFIDKELVSISAMLRDLCVGFIESIYQDKHSYHHSYSFQSDHNERSKLLSFEMKICFKALVRIVCQLHARDARKQFCPLGHWICPSVVIPANKAIDFQLVTSQQGRLMNHMTKEEGLNERQSTTASEIKTVLILQEIPFVISFHDRVQIFHQLLRKEKQIHQSEGYHFGLPGTAIQVQIRRNYIYEDAFEKLSYENEPNMKLPLKVSLINALGAYEAGIDGGGLSKEFLSELLKSGFDPMRGFFKSTKDQLLYPNPSANVLFSTLPGGYETHYEFLGRILGKAIFEKIMVELPLASFFLAKLLARKHSSDVDLHNLASLDPILYKNLVYLKNYKGDVADLNLDFTISNNDLDEHEVVELKPGGSKIPVTRENKIEYVHLVADYRLNKQIRAQCAAFKRGLSQLIDLDWLRMFDSRELQILISGAPTVIDIDDWRRNTLYANGYSDDCEEIETFWKVARQLDENQKRKLLKFATSCSLPPLLGFKDLVPQFTIAPADETRLPTASTCMNLLKLPKCGNEDVMKSKLLYAIESNSGFELS